MKDSKIEYALKALAEQAPRTPSALTEYRRSAAIRKAQRFIRRNQSRRNRLRTNRSIKSRRFEEKACLPLRIIAKNPQLLDENMKKDQRRYGKERTFFD